MKKIIASAILALAALLPLSAPSAAKNDTTIAGILIPSSIATNEAQLNLYGTGIRSKFFMKLYIGSLFVASPKQTAEQIIQGNAASAVRLNILSSMITSKRMTDTILKGFNNATQGKPESIQSEIDLFLSAFNEDIEVGDQFTIICKPNVGVTVLKNGQSLVQINSDNFRSALLAIWLGKNPADKGLKEAMLGYKA